MSKYYLSNIFTEADKIGDQITDAKVGDNIQRENNQWHNRLDTPR